MKERLREFFLRGFACFLAVSSVSLCSESEVGGSVLAFADK